MIITKQFAPLNRNFSRQRPIYLGMKLPPTKRRLRPLMLLSLILSGCAQLSAGQADIRALTKPAGAFASQSLEGWSERSFDGSTHYELVDDDGVQVLKGHTMGAASILYREETIDLSQTPVIHWSWKVDRTYMNINEQSREGDDFPARLYVVAQTGFLPWETVAINYVWASESPIGQSWTNPYTDKAKMIAVQSGDSQVGQWSRHTRNVAEDFKRLFDQNIDELSGYAVMVDGDNAQMEAKAWFGEIRFSSKPDKS